MLSEVVCMSFDRSAKGGGITWRAALVATCIAIGSMTASALVCLAEGEADITIAGRISDHAKHPVSDAQVRLLDEQGNLIKMASCYSDGSFSLVHKSCGKCALEVIPDERTGLATALIDNVSGDKNRNFVVELHRGFSVSGRVTSEGKALKGLGVKVSAVDAGDEHVQGGGFAKTAREGRFRITLTPGAKQLVVLNQRYPDMAANLSIQFTVTADTELPDIVLPPR
jgi:hypothetical protein